MRSYLQFAILHLSEFQSQMYYNWFTTNVLKMLCLEKQKKKGYYFEIYKAQVMLLQYYLKQTHLMHHVNFRNDGNKLIGCDNLKTPDHVTSMLYLIFL